MKYVTKKEKIRKKANNKVSEESVWMGSLIKGFLCSQEPYVDSVKSL